MAVDTAWRRANALLAASQASASLKSSQLQEQHIVSAFLHRLSEQARAEPAAPTAQPHGTCIAHAVHLC